VDVLFNTNSFDLRDTDHKYRLCIDNLHENIDINKCKYRLKKDMVVVSLKKVSSSHWSELKKKKEEKKEDMKKSDDPNAGLMDMMKKM
jgi:calcyclin binding protein